MAAYLVIFLPVVVLSRWVGRHLSEREYLWERGLQSHALKKRKK